MTLEEAIKHCLEVAERYETRAKMIDRRKLGSALENPTECHECAADHRQLAEWLTELKDLREENKVLISECDRMIKEKGELLKKSEQIAEYKRLLKSALEGFEYIKPYISGCYGHCNNCPFENEGWCRIDWKYADEALKLIGGSENVT